MRDYYFNAIRDCDRKVELLLEALRNNGMDKNIDFVTRSILAVPLHVNGECIGAVEALNKSDDNFTTHDMNVLAILANMLANVMVGVLCIQSH